MALSRGLWDHNIFTQLRVSSSLKHLILFTTLSSSSLSSSSSSSSSSFFCCFLLLSLFFVSFQLLLPYQQPTTTNKKIIHRQIMMMIISILLLAVLFIAGLVNIFFHFPTAKFHAWLKSFFTNPSSSSSSTKGTVGSLQVSSPKERKIGGSSSSGGYKKVELKRVFATFDKNGDGFITKQELRESLKNLSLLVTEKEVEEMVAKVDANGDGLIEFDEFCLLYESMMSTGQENIDHDNKGASSSSSSVFNGGGEDGDLKEAFDVFDKDKDGLISVEELGSVLSSLGLNEGKKIENCREMIRKVDTDGDGMVNFDEFRKMMKAGGKLVSAF